MISAQYAYTGCWIIHDMHLGLQVTMRALDGKPKRNYRCRSLSSRGADVSRFRNSLTDEETSVMEYFEARYKQRCEYGTSSPSGHVSEAELDC